MNRTLKIGAFISTQDDARGGATPGWQLLSDLGRCAESVGFDSIWLSDQMTERIGDDKRVGLWECSSVLSGLAVSTKSITLGSYVFRGAMRNPTLIAKIADTIDEISGGRFVLGLGAGGSDPEEGVLWGYPDDHHYERFADSIRIIHSLIRTGAVDYEGRFHRAHCELSPRGPQAEQLPILVAASGPSMMRLTAQYADIWSYYLVFGRTDPHELDIQQERLDIACAKANRPTTSLARTVLINASVLPYPNGASTGEPLVGSAEEVAAGLRAFSDSGFDEVHVRMPQSTEAFEAFGDVIALIKDQ